MHRVLRLFLSAQKTAALRGNYQVNGALRITVWLNIMSEAADFITQILAFLSYDGNSFGKTPN
jgi:hypothetical protein